MMEFENSTRGGLSRRAGSKPLLPPIKKVLVSPTSPTRTQEGLSDEDKFTLWVYNNKNELLGAMSGFDLTKQGFMSAPRVLAVLDQEIKARDAPISLKAAENVLMTAFVATVELNGKTYEDVVNYSQWLHTQWQAGMRIYNKIMKMSAVNAVFNEAMPADLMSDGTVFANNKEARAAKKLVDAVRVTRRAKRDEMEYRAAKELLTEIKFEKIKSPQNRDKVKQTLSAYRCVCAPPLPFFPFLFGRAGWDRGEEVGLAVPTLNKMRTCPLSSRLCFNFGDVGFAASEKG